MKKLSVKCIRCGSDNVSPLSHPNGDRFALNTATNSGDVFDDTFLFVKVDICNDCRELSLVLDAPTEVK